VKTSLIFILSLVLVLGSWLSKPSEGNFLELVRKKAEAQTEHDSEMTLIDLLLGRKKWKANELLRQYAFKDRGLWVTIEKEGKTIYVGIFNTWFSSDLTVEKSGP
jgi:hypothetical protein